MPVKRKFDSFGSYRSYYNDHHRNVNDINVVEDELVIFADAKVKSSDRQGAVLSFFMSLREDNRISRFCDRVCRSIKNDCCEQAFNGCYCTVKALSPGYWYITFSVYKNSL